MDEEVFNMQLRKFLKIVGVTSQREIEAAVRWRTNLTQPLNLALFHKHCNGVGYGVA